MLREVTGTMRRNRRAVASEQKISKTRKRRQIVNVPLPYWTAKQEL